MKTTQKSALPANAKLSAMPAQTKNPVIPAHTQNPVIPAQAGIHFKNNQRSGQHGFPPPTKAFEGKHCAGMTNHGENAERRDKSRPTFRAATLVLALAAAFALPHHQAHAAPQGGQVVAGQATIAQPNANTTTITQSTQKAIIDWQSFSIAANQHTQFIQPSAASVTLNRVVGVDPSQILGRLTANGQVFLVNPNGIYFGKNAQIDVAGLIATTHNIRNEDFLAGNYTFNIAGKAGAAVINDGMIHIADTGIAAFVAPSVANRGIIVARLGKVMLASANGFTLDFSGDQLISFLVNDQVAQTAFDLQGKPLTSFVENAGQIQAQGGYVLLTAKAAENAIHSVINQTGSIEATTVGTHNGTIILNAGTGSLSVAGTLDASALPSPASGRGAGGEGNGGFIETSGAHVKIDPNAKITTAANGNGKAGTWLIDPVNFTIAATGGDITGTQLGTLLNANSVIIQTVLGTNTATNLYGTTGTTGNINVNDLVNWSANKLTLKAHNNIYINTTMNGTGTASLALEYGQQAVALGNTSDYFVKAAVNLPAGQNFSTKLGSDGLVKSYTVITSLGAARSLSTTDLQGINGNLAGNYVLGANIDATPTAAWNAGAGFVPVGDGVAQFVGNFDGLRHTISNLTINRPTTDYVGLFGFAGAGSVIRNVGLTGGNTTGRIYTGALIGWNHGTISYAYATGGVNGLNWVGGLVGTNWSNMDTVSNSYATGSVTGSSSVGGLVGGSSGTIRDGYASGSVKGTDGVGGLVGQDGFGTIINSYASGRVTGTIQVGGLVGRNPSLLITNSYWDTQTSGQPTSAGGTGLTTAQMQQQTNFTGWDFVNTWQIAPNGYPTLKAFTKPFSVAVSAKPDTCTVSPLACNSKAPDLPTNKIVYPPIIQITQSQLDLVNELKKSFDETWLRQVSATPDTTADRSSAIENNQCVGYVKNARTDLDVKFGAQSGRTASGVAGDSFHADHIPRVGAVFVIEGISANHGGGHVGVVTSVTPMDDGNGGIKYQITIQDANRDGTGANPTGHLSSATFEVDANGNGKLPGFSQSSGFGFIHESTKEYDQKMDTAKLFIKKLYDGGLLKDRTDSNGSLINADVYQDNEIAKRFLELKSDQFGKLLEVIQLYKTEYGRGADLNGLRNNIRQLLTGVSVEDIKAEMQASIEWQHAHVSPAPPPANIGTQITPNVSPPVYGAGSVLMPSTAPLIPSPSLKITF